jgi:hypothetical protein
MSADNTLQLRAGQTLITGVYYLFQMFLGPFDTSPIGAGGTINSATLDLYLSDDEVLTGFTTAVASYDWSSSDLSAADWRDAASLSALTDVATRSSVGPTGGSAQYYPFSDTGPGLASVINKTGNTYLIGYSTRHKAGTAPTNAEFIIWEGGGAGSPAPRLTIDYTAGAAPTKSAAFIGGGFF